MIETRPLRHGQQITVRRLLYSTTRADCISLAMTDFPTCIAIYSTRQLCTAMSPNGRTTWKVSLGLESRVCCDRRGGALATAAGSGEIGDGRSGVERLLGIVEDHERSQQQAWQASFTLRSMSVEGH
jgi:hypothetical protein